MSPHHTRQAYQVYLELALKAGTRVQCLNNLESTIQSKNNHYTCLTIRKAQQRKFVETKMGSTTEVSSESKLNDYFSVIQVECLTDLKNGGNGSGNTITNKGLFKVFEIDVTTQDRECFARIWKGISNGSQ